MEKKLSEFTRHSNYPSMLIDSDTNIAMQGYKIIYVGRLTSQCETRNNSHRTEVEHAHAADFVILLFIIWA